MRRLLAAITLSLCAWTAAAGPFDDGMAAYTHSDYPTAMQLWRPLADQGNGDAQFNLGLMYRLGQGVPQDDAEAMKWYRKAADQGFAEFSLGVMYGVGQGVPQDYVEATKWYRKAADRGDANAQVSLGRMYNLGHGVPQDYVAAHKWSNLAAARASDKELFGKELREEAETQRDAVEGKMTPAQVAEAQKLAREWKPAPPVK